MNLQLELQHANDELAAAARAVSAAGHALLDAELRHRVAAECVEQLEEQLRVAAAVYAA